MDRDEPYLARSASAAVILPIVGMLGGLTLGATLASFGRADEIASIAFVLRWGVDPAIAGARRPCREIPALARIHPRVIRSGDFPGRAASGVIEVSAARSMSGPPATAEPVAAGSDPPRG